jgi:hypothetical protein
VLQYVKVLSEDIGFRTVGTKEHALADGWMVEQANSFKYLCERAIQKETGRKLECEVWRQQGNGSHRLVSKFYARFKTEIVRDMRRFDMMGKRLYKTYVNLSNIIFRISDGTLKSKEHAVLVNSHLDSTLPSPGAADDALSVGVMLECMRVLIETPGWSPAYSIIFRMSQLQCRFRFIGLSDRFLVFNNAEESLQDGSHLFSTQHPIKHTWVAFFLLKHSSEALACTQCSGCYQFRR